MHEKADGPERGQRPCGLGACPDAGLGAPLRRGGRVSDASRVAEHQEPQVPVIFVGERLEDGGVGADRGRRSICRSSPSGPSRLPRPDWSRRPNWSQGLIGIPGERSFLTVFFSPCG